MWKANMLLNLSKQLPLTAEKQKFHLANFKSVDGERWRRPYGNADGAGWSHLSESHKQGNNKKKKSIKQTSLQLARHFALRSALSVFTVGTHTRTETREEFSTPVGVLCVYCIRRLASRSGGRNWVSLTASVLRSNPGPTEAGKIKYQYFHAAILWRQTDTYYHPQLLFMKEREEKVLKLRRRQARCWRCGVLIKRKVQNML